MPRSTSRRSSPKSPWGPERRTRENQFDEKRDAVFDMAAHLFRERGFDDTSLVDLAGVLNVTKPTVYYYVESKDHLIYQIKCIAQARVLELMKAAGAREGTGYDKLRQAMIGYAEFMTTDYGVCLSIVPARHMDPAKRAAFFEGVKEANAILERLLDAGVKDKTLRTIDKDLVIRTLFGSLNWIGMWYRPGSRLSPAKLAEQQVDILLDGVRA